MKTLRCLFLLTFLPLLSFAQSFYTLTPDGLRDSNDLTKDYVVIQADGKSAKEIYLAAKNFINQTSKYPTKAIKADTDGEYIRYSIFVLEIASFRKMGIKLAYKGLIEIEMRFKDGRLRYNILDLQMLTKDEDAHLLISGNKMGNWAIFDKKSGKVSLKDPKDQIESFFNNMLAELEKFVNEGDATVGDDW